MRQANDHFNPVAQMARRWCPSSIRVQLLLAVNVPLFVALVTLQALDYRREMSDAVARQRIGLNEEAMLIYHGLSYFPAQSRSASIQQYVDRVCAGMQESQLPGHHVTVQWNGRLLHAQDHTAISEETLRRIQLAAQSPDPLASINDEMMAIGSFTGAAGSVYVSESISDIRQSIQREIIFHFASLAVLAFIAALIVSIVLWRMVVRPMQRLSSLVGHVGRGEYEVPNEGFHCRELNELSAAIEQMREKLFANDRDRCAQMNQARRIQEHLLPKEVKIPGLAQACLFAPADAIAGDYYDMIQLSDDTWLICMADVSGHGVPAAMGAAMLKTLLLSAVEHKCNPAAILQYINRRLAVFLPSTFASMFLARWESASFRLEYASAGHEPGLLISADGTLSDLGATGLLLGIDDDATWLTVVVDFGPGSRLLLTTDGVAEASSPHHALFSRKRLAQLVANCAAQSVDETVDSIRDCVLRHQDGKPPTDDLTVLLLESEMCFSRVLS